METVNFDVKAKLEEKERRSQMVIVGFNLFLTTKPSLVKFEVEGTATLTGKDAEINKMLEINPETKVPYIFPKIYQNAFTAMYLLSTVLNTPSPPHNLFSSQEERAGEEVAVESRIGETIGEEETTSTDTVTVESRSEKTVTEEEPEQPSTVETAPREEPTEETVRTSEEVVGESRSEEAVKEEVAEERTE